MSCLSSSLKTIYDARLASWENILVKALAYLENGLSSEGLDAFKFDSGEAMTWAKYTDPGSFMKGVITPAEAWIDYYRNKINGTGIVRLGLSRGR